MTDRLQNLTENDADSPERDKSSADIGLICGHAGELKPLRRRLDRQRRYTEGGFTFRGGFLDESIRIALVEAGNDFARHRRATELLLEAHQPTWVLSVGFSTALDSSLRPGDLSLANELIDQHGQKIPVKCNVPARNRIQIGTHLTADKIPVTAEACRQLALDGSAIAVDAVSLAVAQICRERSVRFMSIRGIVATADDTLPDAAAGMMFHPDSHAIGGAFGRIVQGWRRASEMNHWRQRAAAAADHLDRFTTGILIQVGEHLENQRASGS